MPIQAIAGVTVILLGTMCPLDLVNLLQSWFAKLRVGGYKPTARRASRAVQLPSSRRNKHLRIHTSHVFLHYELIPYSSDNMSHSC